MRLKKFAALIALLSSTALAYAWLPQGYYRVMETGRIYYVQNGHFCSYSGETNAQPIDSTQLEGLTYDGPCESFDVGSKNYQGRTYYFGGQGGYCQLHVYDPQFPELSPQEAQYLFSTNRYEGLCGGG